MNRVLACSVAAIISASLSGCAPSAHVAKHRISLERFFQEPTKSSFQLSPDGKRYAYLDSSGDDASIFIVELAPGTPSPPSRLVGGAIGTYLWVDSRSIIFQEADPNGNVMLFSIEVSSGRARPIGDAKQNELRFAASSPRAGHELMVEARKRGDEAWGLHRLDPRSGDIEPVSENLGGVQERVLDHHGQYRVATQEDGTTTHLFFRDDEGAPFRRLLSYDNVRDFFRPLFFDPANRNMYAYSNLGRDKVALVEYDPHAGREKRIIYENADYDLFGDDEADFVKFSKRRRRPAYVFFTTWRRVYHFLDDYYDGILSRLQDKFPDHVIRIVSSDEREERHIVAISSDRIRGMYYLFDSTDGSLTLLDDTYPWLKQEELATKRPIRFQSRDGLTIHGYLTLPRGVAAEGLPLVVYVHGGPQWRDSWEMGRFTETQFLANRGYAVLSLNFRGSTGYGKRFMTAGFKQNGLDVQNDVTDAVEYLISRNIVDGDRVGIMGGSYGGYVALAGLTFTPELYACGVDLYGVSNFFTFLEGLPAWFSKDSLYETIGDPVSERGLLEKTSPALHAERIKAPVLIAHGGRDPIVNRRESDQIVDALRERGMPVEYVLKEDEGHGYFQDEQNRLELWRAIEAFFARHLGDKGVAS